MPGTILYAYICKGYNKKHWFIVLSLTIFSSTKKDPHFHIKWHKVRGKRLGRQSGKYSTFHVAYPLVQIPYEFLCTKPSFSFNDHGSLGGKWWAYPSCSWLSASPNALWNTLHTFTYHFWGESIMQTASPNALRSWYYQSCTALDTLPPWHTPPLHDLPNANHHHTPPFAMQKQINNSLIIG